VSTPRLLTAEKLSALFGVRAETIYAWARAGLVLAVHVGRSVYFDPEIIAAWIARGGSGLPGDGSPDLGSNGAPLC
jgi:phage terminase Nu1 subunit (DNA packaging protein)